MTHARHILCSLSLLKRSRQAPFFFNRRYGQPLNSPMAVVVQEMVPSQVAGVMFTCDTRTGNPRNIIITANYGIGDVRSMH